jgi:TPR repeat protein
MSPDGSNNEDQLPNEIESTLALADRLFESEQFEGAEELYLAAAELGSGRAMNHLGLICDRRGDSESAERWYRQGAEAGYRSSISNLALTLYNKEEYAESAECFERAARLGDEDAAVWVGIALKVLGRSDEAVVWFRRAASNGDTTAMANLGVTLGEQGDPEARAKWFEQAAQTGGAQAMMQIGGARREAGELAEAQAWYEKAAALGEPSAMYQLGRIHDRRNEIAIAESWYRRGAEAGDKDSMVSLGVILRNRGDLGRAEVWFRQAAALGDVEAMTWLGTICRLDDRSEESLEWYMKAAELGDPLGTSHVGYYYLARHENELAEEWLRRAIDLGESTAIFNLASLLEGIGRLEEAHEWYEKVADDVDADVDGIKVDAIKKLALLAHTSGDLAQAERSYRRAAESGDTDGMVRLAKFLRIAGHLEEGMTWASRARDLGSEDAASEIAFVTGQLEASRRHLDSIRFDNFGWTLVQEESGVRQWAHETAVLTELYLEAPPDFGRWDADEIRSEILEFQGYIEAPDFDPQAVLSAIKTDLPERAPFVIPDQSLLIDVDLLEKDRAKCILTGARLVNGRQVQYHSSLLVLFADRFWVLALGITEIHPVGEREAMVARSLLEEGLDPEATRPYDPYDRRWDGLLPIEKEPLTWIRLLGRRLVDSLVFGPETSELELFDP